MRMSASGFQRTDIGFCRSESAKSSFEVDGGSSGGGVEVTGGPVHGDEHRTPNVEH